MRLYLLLRLRRGPLQAQVQKSAQAHKSHSRSRSKPRACRVTLAQAGALQAAAA